MNPLVESVPDIQQSTEFGVFMRSIGWIVIKVSGVQIFIKKFPHLPLSFIKIQHPRGPIPFKEIDKIARKYHSIAAVIEPHNFKFNETKYKESKYKKSDMLFCHTATYKIDLEKSEKAILGSFAQSARRNIRKSQNSNIKIKSVDLSKLNQTKFDQTFEIFFSLLKNLAAERNFYIPKPIEFYKKLTAFKNNTTLLFAYSDGVPIAAVWLSYKNSVIYYVQTGITQTGYDLLANYLLVWESIKLAKKKKIKIFDFEGIYDPRFPKNHTTWKNFTQFKGRFHPTLIEFPYPQIKFYSKIFQAIYLCNTIFYRQ